MLEATKIYKVHKRKKPLNDVMATYMLGVNFAAIVKQLVIGMACKVCTNDYNNSKSNFHLTKDKKTVIVELWDEHLMDMPSELDRLKSNFTMYPKPTATYTLEFIVRLDAQEVLNYLNLYMPTIERIEELF